MFVEFDFRERHYTIERKGGTFQYTRTFADSAGTVRDVLTNDGFARYLNNTSVPLTEEEASRYTNSVNSVAYFFLLPRPLHDPAVRKKTLGDQVIDGTPYYRIHVSFAEEGGGEDHTDTFVYWISKEHFTMDYLAYSYESGSGGFRFRKAINRRRLGGILIADYENFMPAGQHSGVETFGELYTRGALEKVSDIVNQNVEVEIL
jgi:hypothetical protein